MSKIIKQLGYLSAAIVMQKGVRKLMFSDPFVINI